MNGLVDGIIDDTVKETVLTEIADFFRSGRMAWTVAIIAGAVVLWLLFKTILKKRLRTIPKRSAAERNVKIMGNIVKIIIIFLAVLMILQVNGINITSLVAGLSLTSVVVGFALQSLLADWISGITIMSERFYSIGDIVKVDGQVGRVLNVDLKVTQIEDLDTGNTVNINNRLVVKAEVLSDWIDVDVPVSYELKVGDVAKYMEELKEAVKKIADVKNCEIKGIQQFADSIIYHRLRITLTDPIKRWQVRRDTQSLIREKYEQWGISVPFSRMDVRILPEEENKTID